MFYQTEDKNSAILTCSCGCKNGLVFEKDEDTGDIWISVTEDKYYSNQYTIWKRLKRKCGNIWRIIRNKEYTYFDLVLKEKDIEIFQDFINNL